MFDKTILSLKKIGLLFLIAIIVWGCATRELKKYLNSQIGIMNYDAALQEYGMPASVVEGEKIFIAAWDKNKRTVGGVFPMGNAALFISRPHGDIIQLTFDKKTKTLINWRYEKY